MKVAVVLIAACFISTGAFAKGGGHSGGSQSHRSASGGSHAIKGYTKKDGTYVAPSHATNPDGTKSNNWSQKGNVNPYTGKEGTKNN